MNVAVKVTLLWTLPGLPAELMAAHRLRGTVAVPPGFAVTLKKVSPAQMAVAKSLAQNSVMDAPWAAELVAILAAEHCPPKPVTEPPWKLTLILTWV